MPFHEEPEPEVTLEEFGIATRLATAAERPGFFTEEQITRLLPKPPPEPDELDVELARSAANRRFSSSLTREAFESLGPNFCNLFPEVAVCAAPPPAGGEARVRRPGAPPLPPAQEVEIRPQVRVPRPRPTQEGDISEFLRSRFAEEALLRGRESVEPTTLERAQQTERLATRAREAKARAEEEAFFQLTPSERTRRRLTLGSLGGVVPTIRAFG